MPITHRKLRFGKFDASTSKIPNHLAVSAFNHLTSFKWADRWSAAELLERLENQLVGDYLRAHDSRFGIFFIGYHGERAY
jgi:hypothetical protein